MIKYSELYKEKSGEEAFKAYLKVCPSVYQDRLGRAKILVSANKDLAQI
jgi:hypothetical protein